MNPNLDLLLLCLGDLPTFERELHIGNFLDGAQSMNMLNIWNFTIVLVKDVMDGGRLVELFNSSDRFGFDGFKSNLNLHIFPSFVDSSLFS